MSQEITKQIEPSYFAVLPHSILAADITDTSKLVCAVIISLYRAGGSAHFTNRYIADLLGKDSRTIRRSLEELESRGYISREISHQKDGKKGTYRKIMVAQVVGLRGEDKNVPGGRTKMSAQGRTKMSAQKNRYKRIDTKNINNTDFKKSSSYGEQEKELLKYINQRLGRNYRQEKKFQTNLKARLKSGYTIEQIKGAFDRAVDDDFHRKNNYKHLSPEFICRSDKLEKFLNAPVEAKKKGAKFIKVANV